MSNWIPTNKMLPKYDEGVLVQVNGKCGNTTFEDAFLLAEHTDEGWIIEGYEEWEYPNVVAWMPLPEPYKVDDKIQQILNRLEEMKSKPTELVYDVGLIQSIIDMVREVGKE